MQLVDCAVCCQVNDWIRLSAANGLTAVSPPAPWSTNASQGKGKGKEALRYIEAQYDREYRSHKGKGRGKAGKSNGKQRPTAFNPTSHVVHDIKVPTQAYVCVCLSHLCLTSV